MNDVEMLVEYENTFLRERMTLRINGVEIQGAKVTEYKPGFVVISVPAASIRIDYRHVGIDEVLEP